MELIQQLDEEDKSTVFKIIDKMLTTKKFKDFFNKMWLRFSFVSVMETKQASL